MAQNRHVMPLTRLLLIAAVILAIPAGAPAARKPAPFEGYVKYVHYHVHYDVNAGGTHVETWDWAIKVLAPAGISEANRATVSYSGRLEKAKILYAYTLKKDGRRIKVPPSNFQEEINKGRGKAAPMFSDIKYITVAFPEVAVGDTVVIGYRITQRKPTLPGNFSFIRTFSKFIAYDDVKVSMSAPASFDMHVEARGVKGGEVASENGRKNWLWTYRNEQIATPEPGAVSAMDYGPMIVASTFKDYGVVASGYNARAKAKAKPDQQIRKLADRLTRTAHAPRQQAAALYHWVAANIAFAGNCVGVGSVVPHAAALVLKNRMGDCKDHSTLLQALLAAKGIASTAVLINSGNTYTLPKVAAINAFNHVITYIPSLKLYADSTARFTPFGLLPVGDADKPVIYTSNYSGIQRTPRTDWKNNAVLTRTVITFNHDGSGRGGTSVAVSGVFASTARATMTYLPPNMVSQAVTRGLARNGYTGTGTLRKDDPSKSEDFYHYGVKYKLTDAIDLPGPGAFSIRSPLSAGLGIASLLSGANAPPRTVDFTCVGAHTKEQYTIHLPQGVKVIALPHNVHLTGKDVSYTATYKVSGDTLKAVREFDDMTPGNVCTPRYGAEFKTFALRALKDVHAKVLYR